MKCPVCGKEITRPLHITKMKDEEHIKYVESQKELVLNMLNEGIALVDIQNDERIILKSTITDYLYATNKEKLLEVGRKTRNKRISEKKKGDGGLRAIRKKEIESLVENGVEGKDFVECRICGLKSTNISSHVTRVHKMLAKDYKIKYNGAQLFCENTRLKLQKNLKQNNPNDNPDSIEKMRKTKASTKDERVRKTKEQFASGERTPSQNIGRGVGGFRPDLGHYCRSMWEANIARILKIKGIEYEFEKEAIPFYDENGDLIDSYLPDFYLTKSKTYLEVKGQMDDVSKKKLDLLKEHHPEVKVFLIDDVVYSKMINSFKNKLDKRLEYSKRNIKTHPHLFEGEF